jgi:hypothetical protein
MRITQRELRKIIREELNEAAMGPAPRRYMYGNYPREMPAKGFTSHMMQQMPRTKTLHIVATPEGFDFFVNNRLVPTPDFFEEVFVGHEAYPQGPLQVYHELAAWCRLNKITHIMTDFLHEMGLPVGDESIIDMPEFYDLITAAGEEMRGDDEPTLEDM